MLVVLSISGRSSHARSNLWSSPSRSRSRPAARGSRPRLRERDSAQQGPLASRSVGGAVDDDDAGFVEQEAAGPRPTGGRGRSTRSTMTNRPPSGTSGSTPGIPRQAIEHAGRGGCLVLGGHPRGRHTPGRPVSAAAGGVLREGRGPSARLLPDQAHRPDELGRTGEVADAPAGHRVGLREAVDHDRPGAGVGRDRRRRDVAAAVVDERLVDLVAEDDQVASVGEVPRTTLRAPVAGDRTAIPTGFHGRVDEQDDPALRRDARLPRRAIDGEPPLDGPSPKDRRPGAPSQSAIGEA